MTTKKPETAKKKRGDEKPIVRNRVNRVLRVELTRDELLDAGQKMADAQQRLNDLDAEAQEFKEQMKGKLAEAQGSAMRYGALVRQKYDHRDVECEEVKDYNAERYELIRKDTGATVERRAMTPAELSVLPMAVEEPKAPAAKPDGEDEE